MLSIEEQVLQMRNMADYLQRYTFTKEDEEDFVFLKTRDIFVSGYELTFCLSKEMTNLGFGIYTLQLYSKYQPFLPFVLVCEMAIKFLGDKELGLIEFIILGRKLYVWSVCIDLEGKAVPIPPRPNLEKREYNNLHYLYVTKPSTHLLSSF